MVNENRRIGITTRLADTYIQELFIFKKIKIIDHTCIKEMNKYLFKLILNRLKQEHNFEQLIKNKKVEINTITFTITFL